MATSRSSAGHSTRPAPAAHGYAELGGHRLYWEQHGDPAAEAVVLLHHGLGSTRAWRRQVPALAAAGYRVVLFDRWGYGRSDPRPGFVPDFLAHDADESLRLLDLLELERVDLIGHSDGGTIALLLAAEHPQRVRSLVVVAAHIYYEPRMLLGLRLIEAAITQPPLSSALEREHGARGQQLARAWVDHWLTSDTQELSLCGRLMAVSAPTLVIQGEHDEHATPQHAIDIAEGVQHGQLWLMQDARHMPMHEHPAAFNQRVIQFLATAARA